MRILRGLVVGLFALVMVVVAGLGLAAYLVDVNGLITQYKPTALQAASQALNREVQLGEVVPTWFPTLGVRAEGIEIGDDPVEPVPGAADRGAAGGPLARFGAVNVGIAVWPALISLGKDIQISEVRLERPEVRVVRYADGSFNFSDIGTSTAAEAPSEPAPTDRPSFLDRLQSASVGQIAIVDGLLRYDDRTQDGLGSIEIRRLGLTTGRVGLGLPVAAELTAALKGTEEPNVRIEVSTGPLAETVAKLAAPAVEKVVLHTQAVPLSILPLDLGGVSIAEAALTTDLEAKPGSGGALSLSGPLSVTGLRLTQPGVPAGAAFDLAVGLAVETSTAFTRFGLDGTEVRVGPLATRLEGEVQTAPELRWDRVKVDTTAPFSVRELVAVVPGPRRPVPGGSLSLDVDTTGDPSRLAATVVAKWSSLSYVQEGLTADGDVSLRLEAQGAPAEPQVDVDLDLGKVGVQGDGYRKPAGMPARLRARVEVKPALIRVAKAEVQLGEAELTGGGIYPTGTKGQVDFGLGLKSLELAPFLAKLGIEVGSLPVGSRLALDLRYQASVASPGAGAVTVPKLEFEAGKSRLSATASVERFSPLVVRVDGRSPFLDLDTLLPKTPKSTPPGPAPAGQPAPAPAPDEGPILPPSMKAARVTIDLEVKKLLSQGIEFTDVDVLLQLKDGVLQVTKTQVGLFGGRFSADGSTFDLGASPLSYSLSAKLAGLRGESLIAKMFDVGDALTGQLDSEIGISGRGLTLASAADTLTGDLTLALSDGRLKGVNILAATILPLQEALEFASNSVNLGIGTVLQTEFRRLAGHFDVQEGRLKARKPIVITTSQGDITLDGGISVDGKLAFNGSIALPPSLLTKLTGGKVRPTSALPVGFGLGCTLTEPCIQNVDVKPAAEALTKMFAGKAVDAAAKALQKKTGVDVSGAAGTVKGVLDDPEAARKKAEAELKKKADEAKAKAEAEARRRTKELEKKAAEEAKKKLKGIFGR